MLYASGGPHYNLMRMEMLYSNVWKCECVTYVSGGPHYKLMRIDVVLISMEL